MGLWKRFKIPGSRTQRRQGCKSLGKMKPKTMVRLEWNKEVAKLKQLTIAGASMPLDDCKSDGAFSI